MFMHISPESNMYGESVSTLNFAKRVAEVTLGQVGARTGADGVCGGCHVWACV